ncbi:MAG: DUF427 domain-containing protein [Pseudomonadota bacterium]
MWQYRGQARPDFAVAPGPGQESVWDYPRPPALVSSDEQVDISHRHVPLASSRSVLRVLETASPPTYYLPEADINWSALARVPGGSFCEWKGQASYWALADDTTARPVAWMYESPSARFAAIDRHASFYPGRLTCLVNGERVQAQPGDFLWRLDNLSRGWPL